MDWSAIVTSVTAEINNALPAFAGVIALVVGVPLAYRVVKRLLR